MIVILSENSISSSWVGREVEAALEKESQQKRDVLYPVRSDNTVLMASTAWIADLRRTRNIGDFTKWKEPDAYQHALRRLLRDLNALPKSVSILSIAFRAQAAVDKWLRELNPSVEQQRETSIPDFIITDKGGNKVGVEVKYYSQAQRVREKKWREYYKYLESKQKDYEKLLMIAVFPVSLLIYRTEKGVFSKPPTLQKGGSSNVSQVPLQAVRGDIWQRRIYTQ